MIARELTIVATTISSNNSQRKHIRLTAAIEFKLLVLLAYSLMRAKKSNIPVGLFRAEFARQLPELLEMTQLYHLDLILSESGFIVKLKANIVTLCFNPEGQFHHSLRS